MPYIRPQTLSRRFIWNIVSVLQSFCPDIFLELCHYFFLNIGMALKTHITLWHFCPRNGPKIIFFRFIQKYSHSFFLNLVYTESLYYLLYFRTNLIFGKNLVPKILVETFLANQIAWFLSQVSQKQNDEVVWFFAWWYKFMKSESWLKNIRLGMT